MAVSAVRSPEHLPEHRPSTAPGARRSHVSLLACIYCRNKHLKCDAKVPVCGRCRKDGRDCRYLPSRRGFKSTKSPWHGMNGASQIDQHDEESLDTCNEDNSMLSPGSSGHSGLGQPETMLEIQKPTSLVTDSTASLPASVTNDSLPVHPPGEDLLSPSFDILDFGRDALFDGSLACPSGTGVLLPSEYQYSEATSKRLLDLYYLHFHAAHPTLLPLRDKTKPFLKTYPQYLIATMQCVGWQYEFKTLSEDYRTALSHMLMSQTDRKGYLVQAKLIFTVVLHAQDQQQQAGQMLSSAIDLALDLGMHRAEFALNNNAGSAILEESWRRTWWELYVLDGMLGAMHQQSSFRLDSIDSDVPLPCEDSDYSRDEKIPQTYTANQFSNRAFLNEILIGSSFAYRVEAIRNMTRILALGTPAYEQDIDEIEAIDATLNSWQLSLPPSKREITDVESDEMIFQAHMIKNASTIFLHQPFFTLASPSFEDSVPCTHLMRTTMETTAQKVHAVKAVKAANRILNLISAPSSLESHSPLFVCPIALSAMVKLSACSFGFQGVNSEYTKEHVIHAIEALNRLSETWAIAVPIVNEMRSVARCVFNIGSANHSLACGLDFDAHSAGNTLLDDFTWQQQAGNEWPDM